MVRRNPAARLAGAWSPFVVLVFLVSWFAESVFHEVGFPDYIRRPPATLKRTKSTTRVLPLLTAALLPLRLQPDRSRAPATRRAGLQNRHFCDLALGEGK
jgi:hypothetical protein